MLKDGNFKHMHDEYSKIAGFQEITDFFESELKSAEFSWAEI